MTTTYGQPVAGEERHEGARPRTSAAELGSVDGRRPGHRIYRPGSLERFIEAEVHVRWQDRSWYRRRRALAVASARTFEGAVDRSEGWQALIDENDRELRTLLRVLRRARRR